MQRTVSLIASLGMAAGTLVFAGVAGAKSIDNWEIKSDQRSCTMASVFEGDVTIGLILAPGAKVLSFMASGPGWEGLRAGETASVRLKFTGDVAHDDWTDEGARIVPAGGSRVAVVANWGADYSHELAKAVSGASTVSVSIGGKDMGTYDLTGSPAAYRELVRCGDKLDPGKLAEN